MMDSKAGQFVDMEKFSKMINAGEPQQKPMPTVFIGEIVSIKGVRFVVLSFKTNGRIRLKMLRDDKDGKIGDRFNGI